LCPVLHHRRGVGENLGPAVQIAVRNAEIIGAADAAAGVPGSSKELQDCRQKFLSGRGDNKSQMTVLPECAKQDWLFSLAYGPATGLPDTKVGTFSQALYDEATSKGWNVISMKKDWKHIFAFEK